MTGYIKDLVIITPALPYKSRFIIRAIDTHRLYMVGSQVHFVWIQNFFSPFSVSLYACRTCSLLSVSVFLLVRLYGFTARIAVSVCVCDTDGYNKVGVHICYCCEDSP